GSCAGSTEFCGGACSGLSIAIEATAGAWTGGAAGTGAGGVAATASPRIDRRVGRTGGAQLCAKGDGGAKPLPTAKGVPTVVERAGIGVFIATSAAKDADGRAGGGAGAAMRSLER